MPAMVVAAEVPAAPGAGGPPPSAALLSLGLDAAAGVLISLRAGEGSSSCAAFVSWVAGAAGRCCGVEIRVHDTSAIDTSVICSDDRTPNF
jgi:hypothetical protein